MIIGAKVVIQEEGGAGGSVLATATDEFGDFWFHQVECNGGAPRDGA